METFIKWVAIGACAGAIFILIICVANADTNYGVLAHKHIIQLPQDEGKWYISVVGNSSNSQYKQIIGWFKSNSDLKSLKYQTHYNEILKGTPTYNERYAGNIKGLPTIRIQDADSRVVYEANGDRIPFTSEGLYAAMARSVAKARGIDLGNPWISCPCPRPQPAPEPDPYDDPPAPPIDGGGAPDVVRPNIIPNLLDFFGNGLLWFLVVDFGVSYIAGFGVSWYKQYNISL